MEEGITLRLASMADADMLLESIPVNEFFMLLLAEE